MSGFEMKDFVSQFAERTLKNLKYIECNVAHKHKIARRYPNKNIGIQKNIPNHHYRNESLYEVTQLLNSLLGLVVIPYEAADGILSEEIGNKRKIGNKIDTWQFRDSKLKELSPLDYEEIISLIKKCNHQKRLKSTYYRDLKRNGEFKENACLLIKHIRNAISHSGKQNICFFPLAEIDSNKEIKGVVFHDEYKDKNKNENFYFAISIIELRRLVVNISTILTRMKPLYSGFGKYNEAKMSPSSTACCKWGKQSLISGEHISRFVETLIGRKL